MARRETRDISENRIVQLFPTDQEELGPPSVRERTMDAFAAVPKQHGWRPTEYATQLGNALGRPILTSSVRAWLARPCPPPGDVMTAALVVAGEHRYEVLAELIAT